MPQRELDEMADAVVGIVKSAISAALGPLVGRIKALEERPVIQGRDGRDGKDGEKGIDGQQGPRGEQGPAGDVGAVGPAGEPGPAGERGERGEKGADGLIGERGPEGPAGISGRDGQPGVPGIAGRDGEKGMDGAAGRDGIDGKDGIGFDDLSVLHDGERGFTFRFTRGEVVKDFTFTIPCVIYRGVYVAEKAYDRGDSVTWGGNTWIAKEATTTKPDFTPAAAKSWQLAVKAGRDGREGKQGPKG